MNPAGNTPVIFAKVGNECRLTRFGYEGGLSPQSDGGWYWWIRSPSGRFTGYSVTRSEAEAAVRTIVGKIESGDDPSFLLEHVERMTAQTADS